MDTSPGVAITISLVLAIVLSTCPATGAFSFPAGGTSAAGIIAGVPGPSDNGARPRVHVIDESFDGKTVHVASGDMLLVQLKEYDPNQVWHLSSEGGFAVVSDVVLEMYPARHDFKVKVFRTGDLRFRQVDSRDGYVIHTFDVRVVIDQAKSGDNSRTSHPLQMLRTISPDMDALAFWRQEN